MFGFVQWDNAVTLVLEVLLSLAIVVGLILVVRRVNARAAAEHQAQQSPTTENHENKGQ
ncbi:MAG TPA: hypothetical protein VFR15_20160 [Chloroflexia bacterium]|nr:hypothetical protein [Chloroflexia bacterium]